MKGATKEIHGRLRKSMVASLLGDLHLAPGGWDTVSPEDVQIGTLDRMLAYHSHPHFHEIRAALERMERGTYGACTLCGNAISPGDLEKDPTARFCHGCVSSRESAIRGKRQMLPGRASVIAQKGRGGSGNEILEEEPAQEAAMETTNQTPKVNALHARPSRDSGYTREELGEFATLLSKMREETKEDIAALHHQAAVSDLGIPDQSLAALIGRQVRHLRNIEHALHRISAGTFGRCLACGKPIARNRLLAVPVTRLCSICKES